MRFMDLLHQTVLIAAVFCFSGTMANAERVTLRSNDESISLTGELISFDGASYRLSGVFGELTLDASAVTCEGAACPALVDNSQFTIAGSNDFGRGLMPKLIEYFAMMQDMEVARVPGDHPNTDVYSLTTSQGERYVDITVLSRGAGRLLDSLKDGNTTFGMLPEPLNPAQKQELATALGKNPENLGEHAVAQDGLVFVVSPKNTVDALSERQLAEIYSGRITNWSEVGGADRAIHVYMLNHDMGEGAYFAKNVLARFGWAYKTGIQEMPDTFALENAVLQDKAGIAFTSLGNVSSAKLLTLRGACGINSAPDRFSIAAGEYPLAHRMFLVDAGAVRNRPAQEFLDFIKSDAAQFAIDSAGFVDDGIGTAMIGEQGDRISGMMLSRYADTDPASIRQLANELHGAKRISSTFRFLYGYARLDDPGVRDMENLANFIRSRKMENREVLIIGFTDDEGTAGTNRRLSKRRAEFVAGELQQALGEDAQEVKIVPLGYGEAAPLVCNDTSRGRDINRRVELWIRSAG